ncbi:MAG: glycosyltransferase [Bacteroidales bacterium]|jgi:glycosyltransferase involved in cell wall biosynthesis|nr:glycosyltransferase [Bacteroidales bacterium]
MENRVIPTAVPGKFNFGTGGVTNVIFRINEHLEKYLCFDYLLATPLKRKEYAEYIQNMGGNVIELKKSKMPAVGVIVLMYSAVKILKRGRYSICYINSNAALGMFFWGIIAKASKIPVVIGHSHCSYMDARLPLRAIKTFCHYAIKPFLPLVIDEYLTCSSKAAAWMYPRSIRKAVVCINNPVDVDRYVFNSAIRNFKRAEYHLEGKFVVGHVGRFAYQKNHHFLLKVFKEILKRRVNAVLFLIGDGSLYEKVKKFAEKIGLENHVVFLGTTPLVHEYMQIFDVFILPSWFEGFPLVGIEAQCSGLPCFFSGAITEESDITGNCHFLSLKKRPGQWANEILRYTDSFVRKDCSGLVRQKGYDVQDCAGQLRDVFVASLKDKSL